MVPRIFSTTLFLTNMLVIRKKENFSGQKVHRHLEFRNQMGSVTLEIEIGDRVDTIVCSPVQAAIINYCSEREISTVEEISKESIFHPTVTSL